MDSLQPDNNGSKPLRIMTIIMSVIALILVVIILLLIFVVSPMGVSGTSMMPGIEDGQHIMVLKVNYKLNRGDIVVFKRPDNDHPPIKRIIAMEGDTVRYSEGVWYVNGEALVEDYVDCLYPADYLAGSTERAALSSLEGLKVNEGELFVLGDNRRVSEDSHKYGCIKIEWLIGKMIAVY